MLLVSFRPLTKAARFWFSLVKKFQSFENQMRQPYFLFCCCAMSILAQTKPVIPTLFDHCLIPLNETHFMSFGGFVRDEPFSSFTDSYYTTYSSSASTMILNATDTFTWSNSSSLPFNLVGASAHALSNTTVIIVFGKDASLSSSSNSILLFDHFNDESETFYASNSPPPRHHHLSFYNSTNNRLFVIGGVLNSPQETRFDTSFGQMGNLDSNLYYTDLSIEAKDWENTGGNITSTRIQVSAPSWTRIDPPSSLSLIQSGLAAASGVIVGKFLLFCFGSSSNIPNNKCTVFDTVFV
jgi:hypothetical protein